MSYSKGGIKELALHGNCGCILNINCPLHKAAPDMYEAIELMDSFIDTWLDVLLSKMTSEDLHKYHDPIKQALAKANGKGEGVKNG